MRTALAGLGEQVPSPNAVLASFHSAQAALMAPEQTREVVEKALGKESP